MIVGLPREIKDNENRVGLDSADTREDHQDRQPTTKERFHDETP